MGRTWSKQDVANVIQSTGHGLGHMVTHYLYSDAIADKKLRELWEKADSTLGEIDEILAPYFQILDNYQERRDEE